MKKTTVARAMPVVGEAKELELHGLMMSIATEINEFFEGVSLEVCQRGLTGHCQAPDSAQHIRSVVRTDVGRRSDYARRYLVTVYQEACADGSQGIVWRVYQGVEEENRARVRAAIERHLAPYAALGFSLSEA